MLRCIFNCFQNVCPQAAETKNKELEGRLGGLQVEVDDSRRKQGNMKGELKKFMDVLDGKIDELHEVRQGLSKLGIDNWGNGHSAQRVRGQVRKGSLLYVFRAETMWHHPTTHSPGPHPHKVTSTQTLSAWDSNKHYHVRKGAVGERRRRADRVALHHHKNKKRKLVEGFQIQFVWEAAAFLQRWSESWVKNKKRAKNKQDAKKTLFIITPVIIGVKPCATIPPPPPHPSLQRITEETALSLLLPRFYLRCVSEDNLYSSDYMHIHLKWPWHKVPPGESTSTWWGEVAKWWPSPG